MKTLHLYFNAFYLGKLNYEHNEYIFALDEESTKMLLKAGVQLLTFELGKKEVVSKELPLVFQNFLPKEVQKQELLETFGVLKTDSDFEKLIKISKLNLNKNGFWLKVEEQ